MTWEYIAGFFEGEGTVTTWRSGHRTHVRLCIPQRTHPEILVAIADFLGYGKIHVDSRGTHRLVIDHHLKIQDFFRGIYPHMQARKKRRVVRLAWQITQLQGRDHSRKARLAAKIRETQCRV